MCFCPFERYFHVAKRFNTNRDCVDDSVLLHLRLINESFREAKYVTNRKCNSTPKVETEVENMGKVTEPNQTDEPGRVTLS